MSLTVIFEQSASEGGQRRLIEANDRFAEGVGGLTTEEFRGIAEEARTTPTGIFNTAVSYWKAAKTLDGPALKTPRNHAPVRFLYFHAMELYLNSYLRACGYAVKRLEDIGHSFGKMTDHALKSGLDLMVDDIEILTGIGNGDTVIRARYTRTGSVIGWLPTEALDATCLRLNKKVGDGLTEKGFIVRL